MLSLLTQLLKEVKAEQQWQLFVDLILLVYLGTMKLLKEKLEGWEKMIEVCSMQMQRLNQHNQICSIANKLPINFSESMLNFSVY